MDIIVRGEWLHLKPCYALVHKPHWWSRGKVQSDPVFWSREDATDALPGKGWRVRPLLKDMSE